MIYRIVYQFNAFSADGSPYKQLNVYGQPNDGSGIVPPPVGEYIVDNVTSQAVSTNDGFALRLNV